ncbi:MAG TPA: hypothetical protein VMR31_11990 [Myxococcota bacterium]|nr:hypothetical protein [Myxococcota bacterium]
MRFDAAPFEALGRRIAAAPRAVLAGLLAVAVLASPGLARFGDVPAAHTGADEALLAELTCDSGLWSSECLSEVDSLTREIARREFVVEVDSLSTRPRFDWRARTLELAPLLAAPDDAAADRRAHARAADDRASVAGVVSFDERSALVTARLRPGVPAEALESLAADLRQRYARPPAFELALAAPALESRALAGVARRDAARAAAGALVWLALFAALSSGSVRLGLAAGGLGALGLAAAAAGLAPWGAPLDSSAALAPGLSAALAAVASSALVHRLRAEERAGASRADAVARALAGVGPALAAAGTAVALGLAALASRDALALSLAALAGIAAIAVGLPAAALVAPRARPRGSALAALVDAALARLDSAARARTARAGFWRAVAGAAALAVASAVGLVRAEPGAAVLANAGAPLLASRARIARDFGGPTHLRVELDAGEAGGALEPLFLERALDFERALAQEAGVGSARSLLDAALLPAMRALHGGDPDFAVVPPTRAQVEEALAAFGRARPAELARALDPARRRLALELAVDAPSADALLRLEAALHAHALASLGRGDALVLPREPFARAHAASALRPRAVAAALAAVGAVGIVGALAFGRRAGQLAAAASACAALAALGALAELRVALDPASSAVPVLCAGATALPAFLYLARERELRAAGAEPGVAASLALRDAGRPGAEAVLAALAFLSLATAALPLTRQLGAVAALACAVGVAAALGLLPAGVRALQPESSRAHPRRVARG